MNDEQIAIIKQAVIRGEPVHYIGFDRIHKIVCIQDGHKERPDDPDETPEPVAWLDNNQGCISLWNSEPKDFVIVTIKHIFN